MHINPTSHIPKHSQFKEIITQRIADDEFPLGAKLPSEEDLAKKYGVSRATVRRAFSDLVRKGVLFSQRGKGTFVIRPQNLLRNPSSSIPRAIAFVTPVAPYNNCVSGKIFWAVEQTALLNGYYVILVCSNDNADWEKHILEDLTQNHIVGGLIIIPSNPDYTLGQEHIARLCDRKIPFILVDKFFRDLPTDYIVSDNQAGAYKAVTHLIQLGHRKIGYVVPAGHTGTSVEDRLSGYKKALLDHGIPFEPELVVKVEEQEEKLRSLLRGTEHPAAFFCMTDLVALRVMRITEEEKKKLPNDVAVVGYDDMDILEEIGIGLTTMRQPLHDEGKMAVMRLMAKLRGEVKPEEVEQVVLTSTLIVRESCGSSMLKVS